MEEGINSWTFSSYPKEIGGCLLESQKMMEGTRREAEGEDEERRWRGRGEKMEEGTRSVDGVE